MQPPFAPIDARRKSSARRAVARRTPSPVAVNVRIQGRFVNARISEIALSRVARNQRPPSLIRKASAYARRRALKNERTFSYRCRSADSRLRRRFFLLLCALEGMESPNTAARLMTPAMQKSGRGLSCVKRRMRFSSQASRQNCSACATGSSTRVSIRRWSRRPSRTPSICRVTCRPRESRKLRRNRRGDRAAAGRDTSRLKRGRTWMSRHDGQTGIHRE